MNRSCKPNHYSAVGIQMMGQMFEQQMRIAHALGMVAIATNPLLVRGSSTSAPRTTRPISQIDATTARPTYAPTAIRHMPGYVKHTHSLPV